MPGLAQIRERYKALLRVNEIALREVTHTALFTGMCEVLNSLLPYDRAGLTLYDPLHDSLRIVALYGPYESSIFRLGDLLGRKTTQNGWTFEHRTRTVRRDLSRDSQFPSERQILDEGFRSLCSVPLVLAGSSIGVVTVIGVRKNQFSTGHAQIVQEMSNQIVPAIRSLNPKCPKHANSRLLCPKCIGAAGGKTTVLRHSEDLSAWGKKGGRGRKKLNVT